MWNIPGKTLLFLLQKLQNKRVYLRFVDWLLGVCCREDFPKCPVSFPPLSECYLKDTHHIRFLSNFSLRRKNSSIFHAICIPGLTHRPLPHSLKLDSTWRNTLDFPASFPLMLSSANKCRVLHLKAALQLSCMILCSLSLHRVSQTTCIFPARSYRRSCCLAQCCLSHLSMMPNHY